VAGWGKTTQKTLDLGSVLSLGVFERIMQYAEVPLVSTRSCRRHPTPANIDSSAQICAGGVEGNITLPFPVSSSLWNPLPGVDSCNGDSGGPLFGTPRSGDGPLTQRGVVSFGTSRCGIGIPGVYTNINHYMSWIRRNLRP